MKILLFLFFIPSAFASVAKLEQQYKVATTSPQAYKSLEAQTLKFANKAVPTLVKVMKSDEFPDKHRWLATMSLARIMGDKSVPFIKKFLKHPHWMLRLAAVKVIRILKKTEFKKDIEITLYDKSMFVRVEALDMIGDLQMHSSAPAVWKMLFDKKNYRKSKSGKQEKTDVIRKVVKTLGKLKYKPLRKSLAKLLKKQKFNDLTREIDQSLVQLTGKKSPKLLSAKKNFWLKQKL